MNEFLQGDDLFVIMNNKAVGHSTQHQISISAETKTRAFKKPAAEASAGANLFEEKAVSKVSVSITADALVNIGEETEGTVGDALANILAGEVVSVRAYIRGQYKSDETTPKSFLSGDFVVTSVSVSANVKEDTTYNIQLENTGVVTLHKDNIAYPVNAASINEL